MPDQPSLWGGRSSFSGQGSGEGFFARLFSGFAAPQPPPPKPVVRRRVTRARDTVER